MPTTTRENISLLLLVGELLLGEGVQEHTRDGNGRAYAAEGSKLVAEHEDAHGDEEHALDGVGHGVRHRVDRVKAVEGHLADKSLQCGSEGGGWAGNTRAPRGEGVNSRCWAWSEWRS